MDFAHFDLEGFQSLFGDFNLVQRRQQSPQPHLHCTCPPLFNQHDHQVWRSYFEQQNSISYGVNSHNKENIREFLNFLQARVRELKKTNHDYHTITVLLVGIPNVGKSALANSLHHIGRISVAEKGKLKHATCNSESATRGDKRYQQLEAEVLPLEIPDVEVRSKLALTGAINDCLIGEAKLAQYFLAILNLSDEFKQWSKLSTTASEKLSDDKVKTSVNSELDKRQKQYATDHTQYDAFDIGFITTDDFTNADILEATYLAVAKRLLVIGLEILQFPLSLASLERVRNLVQ